MSRFNDDREGLSPSPANILDFLGGEDEDDDLFEPATEQSDMTASTAEDDEEVEFSDAQEQLGGIEILLEDTGDDDDDDDGDATETEGTAENGHRPQVQTLTIEQLSRLLSGHGPLQRMILNRYGTAGGGRLVIPDLDDDEDSEEDHLYHHPRRYRRRRGKPSADRFPKVPSDAGRRLMTAGTFGSQDTHVDLRRKRRRNMSERLMWRRLGLDPRPSMRRQNALIAQELIPSTSTADKIIHYDSRAYSGQFSDDGNFFFSCTQNFKVRMYDTSNPYEWQYYKTVDFPFGQWTITDATLSPDNRWLAYSSIRHTVCLASTDPLDTSDYTLLDFTNFAPGIGNSRSHSVRYRGHNSFGVWSLRFSGDGREIVAGTSDHSVVVYDLETRQSTVRLSNHDDDVNAVCFGDKSSPHILYSGSDDQTLRVWDRRSMADGREAGVFVGHTEGLTYVDSKGDGRYVLSNGKDQMMKLWDLRKMMSPHDFSQVNLNEYTSNFDYRFSTYDEDEYTPNPHDCSVVTFRGHSVLKTLIRCHFSPPHSSNSRYVYSGSEDGRVHIWDMDGTPRSQIDVNAATRGTRPRHSAREDMFMYEMHGGARGAETWNTCVRDASWCPTAPVLAATSWNGWGMANGTVSLHSWADGAEGDEVDEPSMASNYNARLERRREFDRVGGGGEVGEGGGGLAARRAGLRSRPVRGGARAGGGAGDAEEGW